MIVEGERKVKGQLDDIRKRGPLQIYFVYDKCPPKWCDRIFLRKDGAALSPYDMYVYGAVTHPRLSSSHLFLKVTDLKTGRVCVWNFASTLSQRRHRQICKQREIN